MLKTERSLLQLLIDHLKVEKFVGSILIVHTRDIKVLHVVYSYENFLHLVRHTKLLTVKKILKFKAYQNCPFDGKELFSLKILALNLA